MLGLPRTFTFHYVSIKSPADCSTVVGSFYLHSTMYLLNRVYSSAPIMLCTDLHSTMYLLNPYSEWSKAGAQKFTFHYVSIKSILGISRLYPVPSFTFHYVSIKSYLKICAAYTKPYLHSTMYLLNPATIRIRCSVFSLFTFHYVSIKSSSTVSPFFCRIDLHSTMYLLNLLICTVTEITRYIYIPLCIY